MFTRIQAKRKLKKTGWTYRSVAPLLHVNFVHLSFVLNGHRKSRRLLARIEALPTRAEYEASVVEQPPPQPQPELPPEIPQT